MALGFSPDRCAFLVLLGGALAMSGAASADNLEAQDALNAGEAVVYSQVDKTPLPNLA